MNETASYDPLEVFVDALLAIDRWAAADLDTPVAIDDWQLVHHEAGEPGIVVVAGTERLGDHYIALMRPAAGGDFECLGLTHAPDRLMIHNPFLGEHRRIRPNVSAVDDHGVFVAIWRAEPGVAAVRFVRAGVEHVRSRRDDGRFVLVDWHDPSPITAFTGLEIAGEWVEPAMPGLPYSLSFAVDSLDAYQRLFGTPAAARHEWIGAIFFELEGQAFSDMTTKMLRACDATRHQDALAALGAGPIYGNGHWFYDIVENDRTIPPENLHAALLLERPEFLPHDVARRYHALMTRLERELHRGGAGKRGSG